MATPKPGEIRCPTCHRSTPPAAFCTQCGSAIPPDARIRPRGMDRDELQERIRARRSGGDPYRRGGPADDDERGAYERFEPDPNDARARRSAAAEARRRDFLDEGAAATVAGAPAAAEPPELTRDRDDWVRPAPAAPTRDVGAPTPAGEVDENPQYVDNFDDEAYDDYPYQYDEWESARERRSGGAGAFAILGFLALGVLALLGGAVLAGIFGGDGTGSIDATPSPSASVIVSAAPSVAASVAPTASVPPDGSPGASDGPIVFPDGFAAETEPCLPGSAGGNGCAGVVDIWVGFTNGNANDVIGARIIPPGDGAPVDGSIDLVDIGCTQSCNGWTYFPFRNLTPGTYEVRITRNGEPAAETSFEVTS
jgi:hypothetical protein